MKHFQDTICTSNIVQVNFGARNGHFNFKSFLFNEDSNKLDIVCQAKLCLSSENCFTQLDVDCGDNYTKN